MIKTQKISTGQLVSLLVLSRVYSIFAYSPSINKTTNASVMILSLAISFGLAYLLVYPVKRLLKEHPGNCLLGSCQAISPILGKVVSAFLCLIFLYTACEAVSQFEYFMTTAVFPGRGTRIFFILLTLTACYFVCMGIEPIARVSAILAVIIIGALAVLAISLFQDIQWMNVTSPLIDGIKPVLSGAFFSTFHNIELIALAMMIPYTNGNMKKSFFLYNLWVLIIFELINFLVITVLGDYARTRTLPIFSLATAASLPFMQGLTAIYNSLWSFIALIRASLYLFLAVRCMIFCFGVPYKKTALPICTVVVLAGGFALSQWILLFNTTYSLVASGIFVAFTLLVIPPLVQMIDLMKNRKKRRARS